MNLQATLLKEHSRKQCLRIVKWVDDDPARFKELMKCFFGGEYRLIQRAAWPMSYCVSNHPSLIKPYFKKLIAYLKRDDLPPAARRNILRSMQDIEIPEKWQGEVMDLSISFIASPTEAIAVKAFALTVLEKLALLYPEILPELKTIIEERWEHESPAVRSRAKKILKKANKI